MSTRWRRTAVIPWLPTVTAYRMRSAIRRRLALLPVLAAVACVQSEGTDFGIDFNAGMSSFGGSVRRPAWPRSSLLRDSVNHALAIRCLHGWFDGGALDVPDLSERLDTLAAGNVLRVEDGRCAFGFPVIVGDQRAELRRLARAVAERLRPTADSIVGVLHTMPGVRPELVFHLLWSEIMDASWQDAWTLAFPDDDGPTNVSWLVFPEHPFLVGTNVASLPGNGRFMTTWSRTFSDHARETMALTYPLHQAAWRRPRTDAGDSTLLDQHGFLQGGQVFRGFVFHTGDRTDETLQRLRQQYGAAVARSFEWRGPTHLDLTPSDQFVILLHEAAYELFALLDQSGRVSVPRALRLGGGRSAVADLTSVQLGEEPSAQDETMALYMSNHWHGNPRVVAAFRELVQAQPANGDALFYLGMALYDVQRYDEAIAVFRRSATAQDVEDAALVRDWSRIWIGHCYDALGDRGRAVDVFRHVVLTADSTSTMQFGQYGIRRVRAAEWARQRIDSPWRWK